MKILLIFPPRRNDSYIFPPTSLLYVAQAAIRAGHSAEILDIPYLLEKKIISLTNESLFHFLASKKFDVLGVGGVVSTYFFYEIFLREFRRRYPGIPVIVGGSVGTPIQEVWEKNNLADYLVKGDGEDIIRLFLDALATKRFDDIQKISGISCRHQESWSHNPPQIRTNIDEIPFLDFDLADPVYYINGLSKWVANLLSQDNPHRKGLKILPLLASRGCPFHCSFCFHFNDKVRGHSADYVIENIRFLKKKYGINCIYLIDDLFVFHRRKTIDLCREITRSNLGVTFFAGGGKPSFIDEPVARAMADAGFIRFSLGIESGDQGTLDRMVKKTTVEQNKRSIQLIKNTGIMPFANMIIGYPGDTLASLNRTKKLLLQADIARENFNFSWAVAYPGTPLFEQLRRSGRIKDTREFLLKVGSIGSYIINMTGLSHVKLKRKKLEIEQLVQLRFLKNRKMLKEFLRELVFYLSGRLFLALPVPLQGVIKHHVRRILSGGNETNHVIVETERYASLHQEDDSKESC